MNKKSHIGGGMTHLLLSDELTAMVHSKSITKHLKTLWNASVILKYLLQALKCLYYYSHFLLINLSMHSWCSCSVMDRAMCTHSNDEVYVSWTLAYSDWKKRRGKLMTVETVKFLQFFLQLY